MAKSLANMDLLPPISMLITVPSPLFKKSITYACSVDLLVLIVERAVVNELETPVKFVGYVLAVTVELSGTMSINTSINVPIVVADGASPGFTRSFI